MGRIEIKLSDESSLKLASEALMAGAIAIFPTDTVYGIGALPQSTAAINRIFSLKQRPLDMPLPLLIGDINQVELVSNFQERKMRALAEKFWPGALTLILPDVSPEIDDLIQKDGTIAVRCPDHGYIRNLCSLVGPIATTSANLHGEPTPLLTSEMPKEFEAVDLIIDGGQCSHGTASTIIDLSGDKPNIIRTGPIPEEEILATLNER